jgi:DNA-binding GntR family transcriptional regulator
MVTELTEGRTALDDDRFPTLIGHGTTTLPAQIHDSLEEAIIRGDIAPSSRLHADEIAAHYGVSRIPVREALRSLHEAGWVDIRPRYGTYVRDRSETELQELFEARSGIESQIAALAAARRTTADLALMRGIIQKRQEAIDRGDVESQSRASMELSSAIRAAAGNSVLAHLSANLEKRARFYFEMVTSRHGSEWITSDNSIVELIAAGASEKAATARANHILVTGTEVAKLLSSE